MIDIICDNDDKKKYLIMKNYRKNKEKMADEKITKKKKNCIH